MLRRVGPSSASGPAAAYAKSKAARARDVGAGKPKA